jgi:hypothetical protein
MAAHRRLLCLFCAFVFLAGPVLVHVCSAPATEAHSMQPKTVADAIRIYATPVREKLKSTFALRNVFYPPKVMTWVGLKQEKLLLIFARDVSGKMQRISSYPIFGASGVAGPKLKEGDKQVPEGFYKLTRFRPDVIAHLGLELNYPNDEDRKHAKLAKRSNLGSDILIHGSYWSTGCFAIGNEAIEELFVLAHDTKLENIRVIMAPCDLVAHKPNIDFKQQPAWLPELYLRLTAALRNYPISQPAQAAASGR